MSVETPGWYGGKRLDSMGLNELSKIKAELKKQETKAVELEQYENAALYRDKGREIQRVMSEALEESTPKGRRR